MGLNYIFYCRSKPARVNLSARLIRQTQKAAFNLSYWFNVKCIAEASEPSLMVDEPVAQMFALPIRSPACRDSAIHDARFTADKRLAPAG